MIDSYFNVLKLIAEKKNTTSTEIISVLNLDKEILKHSLIELEKLALVKLIRISSGGEYAVRITSAGSIFYTCEMIFEMHKSKINGINWTKEVYRENEFYTLAKQKLLQDKIILSAESKSGERTIINASVISAESVSEAKKILETESRTLGIQSIHISGDVHGSTLNQLSNIKHEDAKTKQTDGTLMKFWKLISENKLIATVLAALILAAIYYFFGWKSKT